MKRYKLTYKANRKSGYGFLNTTYEGDATECEDGEWLKYNDMLGYINRMGLLNWENIKLKKINLRMIKAGNRRIKALEELLYYYSINGKITGELLNELHIAQFEWEEVNKTWEEIKTK